MFDVDGFTIRMKRGETGAVCFRLTGYSFEPEDRVIFKLRQGNQTYMNEIYTPDDNGCFIVYFLHNTTDGLAATTYNYDIIVVIHPYYEDEDQKKIADGDQVLYPYDSQNLIIEASAGL